MGDRSLPEPIRRAVLERSSRFRTGIARVAAAVVAAWGLVLLVSLLRGLDPPEGAGTWDPGAAFALAAWQGGGTALLLLGGGVLHAARSRALVEDARPVFGERGAGGGPLGTDIVPARTPNPVLDLAGGLILSGMRVAARWLPALFHPWFVPWRGKTRLVQVSSFDDEAPILAADGRGLFLVSPGAWYYPPSPWLLRCRSGDPGEAALRAFVAEMEAHAAAGAALPALTGTGDAPARTRRAARFAVLGLLVLAVLLLLPIFLTFGWPAVALMAFAAGGMLAVGALARGHDFAGDARRRREGA